MYVRLTAPLDVPRSHSYLRINVSACVCVAEISPFCPEIIIHTHTVSTHTHAAGGDGALQVLAGSSEQKTRLETCNWMACG